MDRMRKKQNQWIWKGQISSVLRALIVAFLVLLQMVFLIDLAIWLREATIYYYTIVEVASFLIILSLVNDNRSEAYKIGWISLVLLLPLSGHLMYLLWGKSKLTKKQKVAFASAEAEFRVNCEFMEGMVEEYGREYAGQERLAKYLEARHFPLTKNNRATYYASGEEAFEAIFEEVGRAKRYVMISFYIVAEGRLFERMYELLKKKAADGIDVFFLYDDFGSMFRTTNRTWEQMESDGIHIRIFNPIHRYTSKLYMNYRSHQKLIIVDGEAAFTGGINLADEYANLIERFGVWKDAAVKVVGDAAWTFARYYLQMWKIAGDETKDLDYEPYRPKTMFAENCTYCQFFADGPNHVDQCAEYVYQQIADTAKKTLYIMTPYLILEQKMKNALCFAAKAGIDVRIITPGVPDKKLVKLLTNYNYGELLRAGVRIYEYKPGFLHSKMIMNESCACVGTINMDYRSFYLHYEDGVVVSDEKFIESVREDFKRTLEQCEMVTYGVWLKRPYLWKMVQPLLNLYAVLL